MTATLSVSLACKHLSSYRATGLVSLAKVLFAVIAISVCDTLDIPIFPFRVTSSIENIIAALIVILLTALYGIAEGRTKKEIRKELT